MSMLSKPAFVIVVACASLGCQEIDGRFEGGFAVDVAWEGVAEAGAADGPVRIRTLRYDLHVWSRVVEGCYEIEFAAESGRNLTAAYRFVLPRGAVIHRAEIFLPREERWETAATLGRREGEEIFEDVVFPRPVEDPLLVQSIGPDVYRARAYPVSEGQPLRSRICYAHLVEGRDSGDRVRVAFSDPGDAVERSIEELEVSIAFESGPWKGGVWSVSDNREPEEAEADSSGGRLLLSDFSEEEDVVLELVGHEASRLSWLAYRPLSERLDDHVHIAWRPDLSRYPSARSMARNVVFVIDVSGSMAGAKLREAKLAVTKALENLDAEDYYGLVAFDTDVRVYDPLMTPGETISDAVAWVGALEAGTSTNIAGALESGARIGVTSPLSDAPVDLILMTDGHPNVGTSQADEILEQLTCTVEPAERMARVFACGIGHDLDQRFLNDLAEGSGGETTFALDDNEIADQFLELFERARGGGVSNVSVDVLGDGVVGPELFGWRRIFPDQIIEVAARGDLDHDLRVELRGEAPDGTPIELEATFVPDLGSDGEHLLAAPLSAMARAERLNRRIDEEGEDPEWVDEAVVLGKQYGILTRYTSLLALETEEMYEEHGIDKLERDAAGIALEPARPSGVNEARVGGAGVDSGDSAAEAASDGSMGCACAMRGAPPSLGAWMMLVGLGLVVRARVRGRGARASRSRA